MRTMRERVLRADANAWAGKFLDVLRSAEPGVRSVRTISTPREIDEAVERVRGAPRAVLFLDYDGTLVPFTPSPQEARPDAEVIELLIALAAEKRHDVHLVSGRTRENVEAWFGKLPIALHAEHGLWTRHGESWHRLTVPGLPHASHIKAILEEFAERTPGAMVEEKSSVLGFHWRRADPEFGARQANELRLHLAELLSSVGAEVLVGDHVIEVRPFGLHKGVIVSDALANAPEGTVVLAVGDDRTDEDLFRVLPESSIVIHVGMKKPSVAQLRLADQAAVRAFLKKLA
jgi:trehalose 6-phosphate synthase/phosphatase